MKIKVNTAVLICCATLTAITVEPSATLFENDQVKVLRALEKPHVKGKLHEHKLNRVMIYLQAGRQRFEYQDGRQPEIFDWKAGEVKWSEANGMHSPEVISNDAFNIIEIELKKPGTGKAVRQVRHSLSAKLAEGSIQLPAIRGTPFLRMSPQILT